MTKAKTRRCSICARTKSVTEFHKRKPSGWHSWCKPCKAKRYRERYQEDARYREAFLRNQQKAAIRRKYGLSETEFSDMVVRQQGMCAICNKPCECVDHCHATGAIRGLLCSKCNRGIGLLNDNPSLLKRAAEYLMSRLGGDIDEL